MSSKKIPFLFILFTLGYIVLTLVFIYISKITYTGTVTPSAYTKGLAYNEVLNKNKSQIIEGWSGNLSHKLLDNQNIELSLTLKDANQQPIDNVKVVAEIVRPVNDRFDQTIKLDHIYNGLYKKVFKVQLPGQWEVRVKAFSRDKEYYIHERIIYPLHH